VQPVDKWLATAKYQQADVAPKKIAIRLTQHGT
jgi:hypothetical protein